MFLEILQNSQENSCARVSFLIKLQVFLRPATLLKKRLWHRCFPVNFVNFLRTFLLQNTSEPLLPGCDYCIFTVAVYSKIERNCLELLAPTAVVLCLWDIFFKFIFIFCCYVVSIICISS